MVRFLVSSNFTFLGDFVTILPKKRSYIRAAVTVNNDNFDVWPLYEGNVCFHSFTTL